MNLIMLRVTSGRLAIRSFQMDRRLWAILFVSCALLSCASGSDAAETQNEGALAEAVKHLLEMFGVKRPHHEEPADKDVVQYMTNLYNTHQDYIEGRSTTSSLLYEDETVLGIPTRSIQSSQVYGPRSLLVNLVELERTASSELTRALLRIPSNSVEDCQFRVTMYNVRRNFSAKWKHIIAGSVVRSHKSGNSRELDIKDLISGWLQKRTAHLYHHHHGQNTFVIIAIDPIDCHDDQTSTAMKLPFLVVFSSPHHLPLPSPGSHKLSKRADTRKKTDAEFTRIGGCQQLNMEVDFKKWKWTWILAPEKYNAFFCNGSCLPNRVVKYTQHAKAIAHAQLSLAYRLGAPSCAPSKLSKKTILFRNKDASVKLKNLEGMVATECKCR